MRGYSYQIKIEVVTSTEMEKIKLRRLECIKLLLSYKFDNFLFDHLLEWLETKRNLTFKTEAESKVDIN